MNNKKLFFTIAICAVIAGGMPIALASSNDLLRMDVKKSSAQDTVDVTFYTTGNPTNSVVTRKSGNSYVVLLPNISGNQSVVPSLGGVKDLVSDVTVKNVDDGIGGYTKIIFNTTKPVRIQTATKQTAPLTSAQQDYKNLIAKSNNIKPINNTSTKQPVQAKTTTPAAKQTATTKTTNTTQPKQTVPIQKPAVTNNVQAKVQPKTAVKTNTPESIKTKETPKVIDKAPVKQNNTKTANTQENKPQIKEIQKAPVKNVAALNTVNKDTVIAENKEPIKETSTNKTKVSSEKNISNKVLSGNKETVNETRHTVYHRNSIIPLAAAFCLFGIFLFVGLAQIITKGVEDKRNRLKEYIESEESQKQNVPDKEFQEIIDDKKSNWQEKYKKYTKVSQSKKRIPSRNKLSYIADISSSKGMVVANEKLAKKDMNETISRMEHSLAQTPVSEHFEDFSPKYHSEDDVISKTMSDIKLKSFANPVDLTHAGRNLVSFEELASRQKTLKEGKFVKMNNSPLTMSKRKSASSGLNFANIVRNNNKFAHNQKDEEIMTKQQEDYVLSSINEYMNLLDNQQSSTIPMIENPEEISKALENAQQEILTNNKSLVTNPMISQRKAQFTKNNKSEINGLNIKSNYNIDSNRSIYMVDLEGISAIIGKIGEEIFILKKFDKIINKPMQVRLDYGNTYIVRVGSFKCLVDITENKMGTLLEI